jgi:Zn-dependent protease with chaperone function
MLAVELLMLAMAGIGMRLLEVFEPAKADGESSSFEFGFGFDFSGIILVVTLFILARVFRQGAEMRADLEGTV